MNKEKYCSIANIDDVTNEVFKSLYSTKFNLDLKNSCLIVIDMQEYFLNESSKAFVPSSKAIIPKVKILIDLFSKLDRPIIFTKHINTENNAGLMNVRWRGILSDSDPLSKLYKDLNSNNGIVINKPQFDSFYKTNLEIQLNELNIDSIFLCGVMTNVCVDTTARSGFVRGFKPFVIADSCAANNYAFHLSSLISLSHFCDIIRSNDIIDKVL